MKTKKMNEIEKMKGYLQMKEYYRECNEHLGRYWARHLNTHGDAHVRYLICKGLMTMEQVEPWLEALYKIGPIPAPELKALSLLASALRSCPNWVIKTDMTGQHPQVRLLHHYSEDTTFILDITQMIEESGWKKIIHRPADGSWSEYIYRKNDNIRFSIESTASGELASESVCIEIGTLVDPMVPMLDACASFVLWAENGFPDEGTGIKKALLYSMDPSLRKKDAEERLRVAREERHRQDDDKRRRDLVHELFEYELSRLRSKSWEDIVSEAKARRQWFEEGIDNTKYLSDYFAETILQIILEGDDPYQDLSVWRVNPDSYTLEKKSEKEVAPK